MADTEYVHVRGEGGQVIRMDLPLSPDIEKRIAKGILAVVAEDGTPLTTGRPPRPAASAAKGEWVAWAIACGAEPDAADGMTKADLVEQYGQRDG